jgi:hypothetical protein
MKGTTSENIADVVNNWIRKYEITEKVVIVCAENSNTGVQE